MDEEGYFEKRLNLLSCVLVVCHLHYVVFLVTCV